MERLPKAPKADTNLLALIFDALDNALDNVPIIGDIVRFISSLFGKSSASESRIARLETIVSKGATGFDDFNRADTGAGLGRGPSMTVDWITGGNGEVLRIADRAARLQRGSLIPAPGRRWARFPVAASSSAMTADTIVDDKNVDNEACTSLIVCANEAFTEGIIANIFGTGIYLARFSRSGDVWTMTDFDSSPTYRVGTAQRVELRASGSGLYSVLVDGQTVCSGENSAHPITASYRWCGFATQMAIPAPFAYRYGWGLSAFAMRSEAGTWTGIESVGTVANQAQTTAQQAQTTATNAVSTAVTQATAAAQTTATTAAAAAVAPVQTQVQAVRATILSVSDAALRQSFDHSMVSAQMTFDGMMLDEIFTFPTRTGSGGSSGNSHSHAIPSVTQSASEFTPPINVAMGGWVSAKASYTRESFVVGVGAVTAPACSIEFAVFVLNADTGNLECRWASGDKSSDIGTSARQYVLPISPGSLISDGDSVLLTAQQWGSGNVRPISARRDFRPSLDGSVYPAVQYGRFGVSGPVTVGAVLPITSLDTSVPWVPWLGMGPSLVIPPKAPTSFYESFDDGIVPAAMTNRGNHSAIITNGWLDIGGGADGFFNFVHSRNMNTDNHFVEARVVNPSDRHGFLSIRSTSDGGTRMVLEVRSTGLAIVRQTGASSSTLTSFTATIASGDIIRWGVIGNVYRVWVNGTYIGGFTDSGNALPIGAANRWITIGSICSLFVSGAMYDYFAAQDQT